MNRRSPAGEMLAHNTSTNRKSQKKIMKGRRKGQRRGQEGPNSGDERGRGRGMEEESGRRERGGGYFNSNIAHSRSDAILRHVRTGQPSSFEVTDRFVPHPLVLLGTQKTRKHGVVAGWIGTLYTETLAEGK